MDTNTTIPDNISAIASGMTDGTLAKKMKVSTKYITNGIFIGAGVGLGLSMLTGGCKFCHIVWGSIGGAGIAFAYSEYNKAKTEASKVESDIKKTI